MKQALKKIFHRMGSLMSTALVDDIQMRMIEVLLYDKRSSFQNRIIQRQAMHVLRSQMERSHGPLDFDEIGFDVFSQTREDGILLSIFAMIGFTNRRCVDIGSAGIENGNVANLIIHHDFIGMLIDGNERAIIEASSHYQRFPSTQLQPPKCVSAFVTAENINALLADHSFVGSVDLLSIDVDGNDYWIWKAIDVITPRVVLIEYQDILGPERSCTIPYDPAFDRTNYDVNKDNINYAGASLGAFVKLAKAKGYRLVGCNRGGWNAFFVQQSIECDILPEVSVRSCFRYAWNEYGMKERYPLVEMLPWQEV